MKLILSTILVCFTVLAIAKDEPIELGEIQLFKEKVKIKIPTSFKELNKGEIKEHYPSAPSVKLGYKNDIGDVRIAFGSDDLLTSEQSLPAITTIIKKWLKDKLEKTKWKNEAVKDVNGNKVGYLEYFIKKPEKSYEFIFFTLFRGQMLTCSLTAPKKGFKTWKEVSYQMMESLILIKNN